MPITGSEIQGYAAAFLWPLLRIGAFFTALPVLSSHNVPLRVRVVLAVAVTGVVMPLLPPLPDIDLFGYQGWMVGVQQILIGILTGLILQVVFDAVVFAGQSIAYSMGLGFASLVDPQTGVQVPVVSQFYLVIATLVFLNMDGHLLMIKLLLDSFRTIPVAIDGVAGDELWTLIAWSGRLFAGGLLLSLPVVATLLLVNISFGVATRAAPQLNIFSVGFPVTLMLGLLFIWLTLPHLLQRLSGLLGEAYEAVEQLLRL